MSLIILGREKAKLLGGCVYHSLRIVLIRVLCVRVTLKESAYCFVHALYGSIFVNGQNCVF